MSKPELTDPARQIDNLISVLSMRSVSRVIEDQALQLSGASLYVGFQKFSRVLLRQKRYTKNCKFAG